MSDFTCPGCTRTCSLADTCKPTGDWKGLLGVPATAQGDRVCKGRCKVDLASAVRKARKRLSDGQPVSAAQASVRQKSRASAKSGWATARPNCSTKRLAFAPPCSAATRSHLSFDCMDGFAPGFLCLNDDVHAAPLVLIAACI